MKHDFSDFFPNKKESKYKNKRTLYNGVWYQSGAEAKYAEQLDALSLSPKTKPISIERQVEYKISQNGVHMFSYFADFRVTYSDRVEVIDVKGVRTDYYKLKKKFVENFYNIKIKEVRI